MYYTVYKITNIINGKFYIGVHKTNNLNDDYMGSGTVITMSIDKYGIHNFHKEILFIYDNELDMYAKEIELVTEEFVKDNSNYNVHLGGKGGWDFLTMEQRIAAGHKGGSNSKGHHSYERTQAHRAHISKVHAGKKLSNNHKQAISVWAKNVERTDEWKNKQSIAALNRIDDIRETFSKANKDKPKSPEQREKIRRALLQYHAQKKALVL